jgi:hypothetical protein
MATIKWLVDASRWLAIGLFPLLLNGNCGCHTNATNCVEEKITWTDPGPPVSQRVEDITCTTIPTYSDNLTVSGVKVSVPVAGTAIDVELGTLNVSQSTLQQVDTIWGVLDEAQFAGCVAFLSPQSTPYIQSYYTVVQAILTEYAKDLATAKTEADVKAATDKAQAVLTKLDLQRKSRGQILRDRPQDRILRDRPQDRILQDKPQDRILQDKPQDRILQDKPQDRILRDRPQDRILQDKPQDKILQDKPQDKILQVQHRLHHCLLRRHHLLLRPTFLDCSVPWARMA